MRVGAILGVEVRVLGRSGDAVCLAHHVNNQSIVISQAPTCGRASLDENPARPGKHCWQYQKAALQ